MPARRALRRAWLVPSVVAALVAALGLVWARGDQRAYAAPDTSSWQTAATGLTTGQNQQKATAGLSFTVEARTWPFLRLQGGVKPGAGQTLRPSGGIDLGLVEVPGQSGGLSGEAADWAHNSLDFTAGALRLTVSRLSPAILVQSSSNALRLLSGPVAGHTFDGRALAERGPGPAAPRYVAYASQGALAVQGLSQAEHPLPRLDDNWVLVWYGSGSHFVDTKKPLTYTPRELHWPGLPQRYAYQADAPLLLVFQTSPTAIRQSPTGGIDLSFSGEAGSVAVMPLFGREHPQAAETEAWALDRSHPGFQAAIGRAQAWARRLCSFPVGVSEAYGYDQGSDTATITESMTFARVCDGGTLFAPIPPALGVAREILPVSFSGNVTDAALPTEFGPLQGIEGTSTYSWSVSGLRTYTDARQVIQESAPAPPELEQELDLQVARLVQAGHLAPWLFHDGLPHAVPRGDVYWANPGDAIRQLTQILPALREPARSSLLAYIKSERAAFPPESVFNMPLDQGASRGALSLSGQRPFSLFTRERPDLFLQRVPLLNFYALAYYHEATGELVPGELLQQGLLVLDGSMREQDWASMYWFRGFDEQRVAVVNANRHFAGLIGLVRLAQLGGDASTESLARALLVKAAVSRLAMAHYPRYLYAAGLEEIPTDADPNWQVAFAAGKWEGYVFVQSWTGPFDDPRQVSALNQFEAYLYDSSGFRDYLRGYISPSLTAYRDMPRELGRLLRDHALNDGSVLFDKATQAKPHWYAALAEASLGVEHNLDHPIDSYQLFMAAAWIKGLSANDLAKFVDLPWLERGDLFYLHKLAEAILAYRAPG